MRILQISPQIPYPLIDGGRRGIYGITKSLSMRGHKIDFIAYQKNTNIELINDKMREICNPHFINFDTPNNILKAFINLFQKEPYNISKFISDKLEKFIIDFFKNNKVDIIHIDHLHMSWIIDLLRNITDVPIVLREHNLELKIMKRFYENQNNLLLKNFAKIQYKKFIDYEPTQCSKFDLCLMITKDDENSLLNLNPKIKTTTIPVGVDEELFNYQRKKSIPFSICHIGSMDWFPNYDGLQWYLNEVFPEIVELFPDVKLFLYGKGTQNIKTDKKYDKNIIKVGFVNNLFEEILDKDLLIVPLRIGGGIRVKIMEMMALGQIILSTSIGKEGIEAKDEENILIADDVNQFIDKTVLFFNNKYDKTKISSNARTFIKEKYTWPKIGEQIEKNYLSLIKNSNSH